MKKSIIELTEKELNLVVESIRWTIHLKEQQMNEVYSYPALQLLREEVAEYEDVLKTIGV